MVGQIKDAKERKSSVLNMVKESQEDETVQVGNAKFTIKPNK